jgi:hypothetical protein
MFQYKNKTPLEIRPGKFPHVGWVDISGKGIWEEVAIMSIDGGGSIHFFPLAALDRIDRQRFFNIVASRTANSFPLYELCSQVTLGNGINALSYFQQLVKVLTPTRQVLQPRVGQIGTAATSVPQSIPAAA